MIHRRRFVSILAILALLLGNASGWMHVHHHASIVESHAAPQVGGAHRSCVHATCCSASEAVAAASQDSDERRESPIEHHHDSEHCAVCQLFLAVREAATSLSQPPAILHSPPVLVGVLPGAEVRPEAIFTASSPTRGPPRF